MPEEMKLVEGMGFKAVRTVTLGDEAKGEVTAVVATFDEVDNDGEVIVSGAIPDGMKVTASSYNHDTVMGQMLGTGSPDQAPVAKGTIQVEGNQAVAHLGYFMETQRGKEAFLTLKAMGADQAWSFAYRKDAVAEPDKTWMAKGARLMLTKLGPLLDGAMEVSPVKQPGGKSTGTVEVKQAAPPVAEVVAPIPATVADPVLEGRIARVKRSLAR